MEPPLVAVPRLLVEYYSLAPKSNTNHPRDLRKKLPKELHSTKYTTQQECFQEIKRITSLSILDFPSELVASSIADLRNDHPTEAFQNNFLRLQRGSIGHIIMLGALTSRKIEVVERIIEIACCLDLLCQQHRLAVCIVDSLRMKAVSRLKLWKRVRPSLVHKMEEIEKGSLAQGIHGGEVFRAPRDISLEYWLLSRPYVNDEQLLAESFKVQPPKEVDGDVETRLNDLERVISSIDVTNERAALPNKPIETELDPQISDVGELTDSDAETEPTESEEDVILEPQPDSVQYIANQTRERISQQLEAIKNNIHSKVKTHDQLSSDIDALSIPSPKSIDPFDQRAMLRVRANKDGKSGIRRLQSSATYSGNPFDHPLKSPGSRERENQISGSNGN
jgi:hypothetical protein